MKNVILIAALASGLVALPPAARAADDANGAWGIVSTSGTITQAGQPTRWRYGFDAQWRHFDRGNGSDQYVLRPSVGYQLKPGLTAWAGYGYFLSDPNGGSDRYEHRWWQQLSWSVRTWDWGSLSLRTRLEERIVEDASDTGLRFRQMIQLAVPFPAQDVTLITSVEHYTNLRDTDWGARSGFDQLRSYIGVQLPMSDRFTLEAGYMNQYINRNSVDAVNHLAMLHLRVKL